MLKSVLSLVGAAVIAGLIYFVYAFGHDVGSNSVQVKWDREKQTHEAAIEQVRATLQQERQTHAAAARSIERTLLERQRVYDLELRRLDRVYIERLHVSEVRADRYRREAEGGPAERDGLASHAAELDRSLEQGIHLVDELQAAIGFKDAQLKALAEQITTDRKLLDEN